MCQHPTFTLRVQRLRLERCLTQPALAAQAGMANIRIWRLEHGQCDPRLSDLLALASTLGCTVEDLYTLEPCATIKEDTVE